MNIAFRHRIPRITKARQIRSFGKKHAEQANYYKILGLDCKEDNSIEDVKKSYLRMAQLYHPDKNEGYSYESHENFLIIVEAYDILSNPDLKYKYDIELRNRENPNFEGAIFDHPFAVSRAHGGYRKVNWDDATFEDQ